MSVQTVKLGGKEFVILPKREYERLTGNPPKHRRQSEQDKGDIAEANRRLRALARGRTKTIPLEDLAPSCDRSDRRASSGRVPRILSMFVRRSLLYSVISPCISATA
jgi:hypothetical protein